jgi:hypothetical protein
VNSTSTSKDYFTAAGNVKFAGSSMPALKDARDGTNEEMEVLAFWAAPLKAFYLNRLGAVRYAACESDSIFGGLK